MFREAAYTLGLRIYHGNLVLLMVASNWYLNNLLQEPERGGAGLVVHGRGAPGLFSAQLRGGCRLRGAAPGGAVCRLDAVCSAGRPSA